MATLYNKQTRLPEELDGEAYQEALKSGTHAFKAGERVNFFDPSGTPVNLASESVPDAIAAGYKPLSPTDEVVQRYVDENKGLKGTLKVAIGQAVDEAAMGIPETIYDRTADPLEVAKKEALKKDHNLANTLGGIAGFGGSLLYGGPLFKGAAKAGELTTKALGEVLATKIASTAGEEVGKRTIKRVAFDIAKDLTAKGAGGAVEGAVLSAPRAVTEAALGDPDDAAETLMSGLEFGGILGGAGSLTKKLTGAIANKVRQSALNETGLEATSTWGDIFKGKANQKAVEALNPTLAQIKKIKNTKDIDQLGQFLREEGIVTPLAKQQDMYDRLVQKTDEIGQAQGDLIKSFDDRIMNEGLTDALIDPKDLAEKIRTQVKDKFGDKFAYKAPLASFEKQLDDMATSPSLWTIGEANAQKSALGKVIKTWGLDKSAEKTLSEDIYKGINSEVKNKIKTHFGQDALDQLETLNKKYGYLEEAEKIASNSAARDAKNNDFGLTSWMAAGGGALAGGPIGAAVGLLGREGTRRYGNQIMSAVYDKAAGLLFAEQAMKKVAEKMDTIPEILKRMNETKAGPLKTIGTDALLRSRAPDADINENKQHSVEERTKALDEINKQASKWVSNPEALTDHIASLTTPLSNGGAPQIGAALSSKMINGLSYLNTQIPKPVKPPSPFVKEVKFRPSDHAMAAFEQKLSVVRDPFQVLHELEHGTLTKNHMDALQAVYPGIARMIKERITKAAYKNPKPMDYSKRLKLSLILGTSLDDSTKPESVQYYQQTYANPDQAAAAQAQENGGFKAQVEIAKPMLTDTQRVAIKTL